MKIAMIGNLDSCLYVYRAELIEALIQRGHTVYAIAPMSKYEKDLKALGCEIVNISLDRHGKNIFKELGLIKTFKKVLKEIKPDIVFTYTIKPNIYASMACQSLKIPYCINVTGLGLAVEKKGLMQKLVVFLYKKALKKVKTVFLQNQENLNFFLSKKIIRDRYQLIPGSGVNLTKFKYSPYPHNDIIKFGFVSRVMKEKGIDNFLDCAKVIKEKYPNTSFDIYGFCEDEYKGQLDELASQGIVNYHGLVKNIEEVYRTLDCLVHPTYYPEGMSNVLLESCATGRPIITTDRSGCREIVEDGINGYIIKQQDTADLIKNVEKFINLSWEEREAMGVAGRKKVEKEFDRNIVINAYLNEIGEGS